MNPNWNFAIDSEIPDRIGADGMFPTSLPSATTLCAACKNLKFGDPGFNFTYLTNDLKSRAPICGLCSMLWSICVMHNKSQQREVKFEKYQSTLKMGDDTTPVLSMISSPGMHTLQKGEKQDADRKTELKTVTQLQLGFPELPESGSDMHFNVIRHWLASCDTTHNCAPGSDPRDVITLPTRLIDVGSVGSPTVRLVETKEVDIPIKDRVSPYIALSHPWGPPPHFCTFPNDPGRPLARNTLAQHKVGIDVSVLPATFRDGVIATRALGKKYLWVDSLCILQGPKGDFQDEAVKMETVFSSAYCVLAASWAAKQEDGFLKTMPGQEELRAKRDRKVITIKADNNTAPLYICEMIDNFDQHVLNGGLNQRAWVLQERALARRTVYFTERQTYWECGEGVRCETMTKMTKYVPPSTHTPTSGTDNPNIPQQTSLIPRRPVVSISRPARKPRRANPLVPIPLQAIFPPRHFPQRRPPHRHPQPRNPPRRRLQSSQPQLQRQVRHPQRWPHGRSPPPQPPLAPREPKGGS